MSDPKRVRLINEAVEDTGASITAKALVPKIARMLLQSTRKLAEVPSTLSAIQAAHAVSQSASRIGRSNIPADGCGSSFIAHPAASEASISLAALPARPWKSCKARLRSILLLHAKSDSMRQDCSIAVGATSIKARLLLLLLY